MTRSPLAPEKFPDMPTIDGLRLSVASTGIKYKGRNDLLLMTLSDPATVAGVFTISDTAAAPVKWCRKAIVSGATKAILTNAGNANAFTGQDGENTVRQAAKSLRGLLNASPDSILLASTGVIGEPLDANALISHFPNLLDSCDASWEEAANAILTTDTFAKGAHVTCQIDDVPINICGIAKGSGMIAPNMATMLGYVATNAALPASILETCLASAIDQSFNSITVDGDTSTNDSLFLIATGQAQNESVSDPGDTRLREFRDALTALMVDLATQIVRDGEGASKFITITICGTVSDVIARNIGFAIANSPLVKTAIAGEDPNWGRIVMAIGKNFSGIDVQAIGIKIGGYQVAKDGVRVDNYDETEVLSHMKTASIDISVSVGSGAGSARIYSCDLTHGYISINADYRS